MAVLTWDGVGKHLYETGVDHGVLYLADESGDYTTGFAWNGLSTVTESPSGAEATPIYADNIKYLNLVSIEEFSGTIEALTYPDEFCECDGSAEPELGVKIGQQPRRTFGLSYRTRIGNELSPTLGFKLHLVWGATAAPSEKAYATVNDSPEAITFSWEFWTVPVSVTIDGEAKVTASMTIDSTKVAEADMNELLDFLNGTVGSDPSLPTPNAVLAIFAGALTLVTPGTPTYNSSTDLVTIPGTTGVQYKINGVNKAAGTHAITASVMVTAHPMATYKFAAVVTDEWAITFA